MTQVVPQPQPAPVSFRENSHPVRDTATMFGVGAGVVGGGTGLVVGGFKIANKMTDVPFLKTAGKAGLMGGVVMAELAFLSTLKLPDNWFEGGLAGGAVGTAAVAGGALAIGSIVDPKLLSNGKGLATVAMLGGAAGILVGSLVGVTGLRD